MKHATRPLYRHSDLVRTLAPTSVAVIGASARAGSFGHNTVANLTGYAGVVMPVNEKYTDIAGYPCFPSIAALPQTPDCAIVAVPRPAVEQVLLDCAARGVGGAVVFASGYAESGIAERIADQERLNAIARETGLRIVGPNCVGILNATASLKMSFSTGMDATFAGVPGIGIASQSGGMGSAVAQVSRFGIPVSHMMAAGNSCDVDVADYVSFLAEDPNCAVIVCLLEGMSDPRRLIEAGMVAQANDKPLIVCKIATSTAGIEAAMSHTGVLAGSNAAYAAAFRQMNAIVVDNLESLARTATFMLKVRKPSRGRAMVLASSGGFCTVAVDKAELYGVELTPPSEDLRQQIEAVIPEFGRAGNPTDMTAQTTQDGIKACYELVLSSDEYDTVVSPVTFAAERSVGRVKNIDEAARKAGKVACLVWATAWTNGPGFQEAASCANLAPFLSMEECFRTLAAWQGYERRRNEMRAERGSSRVAISVGQREGAGELLLQEGGSAAMTERASKSVLRHYGLPMVEEKLARSADEAAAAADALGYPTVLKMEIDGLAHKTEAGGVVLDLRTEADVRAAYERLVQAVEAQGLREGFKGVLVQPMVGKGLEIIAGVRVDPQFGPTVMVGIGGTFVEVLQDSVVDFAPLTLARAESMVNRLRSQKLLDGARGAPPINRRVLADVLCRLSEFAADHADRIVEVDINPLLCAADRVIAVDALVVRK